MFRNCIVFISAALLAISLCGCSKQSQSAEGSQPDEASASASTSIESGVDEFEGEETFVLEVAGVSFIVPEYFNYLVDDSDGEFTYHYAEASEDSIAFLMTSELEDYTSSTSRFPNDSDTFMEGLLSTMNASPEEVRDDREVKADGVLGRSFKVNAEAQGKTIKTACFIFLNEETGHLGLVSIAQTEGASSDYLPDFDRIVSSCSIK